MGPEVAAAGTAAGAGASAISPQLAAALFVGGTAAQMAAAQQQKKQQQRIINRAFEETDNTRKEATDKVLTEAQGMTPGKQLQSMRAAEDAAYGQTMNDLKGAGADIIDTAGGSGNVSSEFQRAKAERTAAEGDRLSGIARETARVRAPGQVQFDEALSRSALAEELGSAARTNAARTQTANLRAQAVEAPLYGDLGKIAALVGGMGLSGGTTVPVDGAASGAAGAAYLGEGVASGVPAWDTAMASAPAWRTASPYLATAQQSRQARPWWWSGR